MNSKQSHLFESSLENRCLPKVIFLPYLTLIHLWNLIQQLFWLVFDPIKSENQCKNTSHNKDIILLLTFLKNYSYDSATNFSIIGWLDDHFVLKSILFNENEGGQSVKMMFCHVSFENGEFVVESLDIDLLAIPKQRNNACNLYVIVIYFVNVGRSYPILLIAGSQIVGRMHYLESGDHLFKLVTRWFTVSVSRSSLWCSLFLSNCFFIWLFIFCLSILLNRCSCFFFCFLNLYLLCYLLILFQHSPYVSDGISQFFVSLSQIKYTLLDSIQLKYSYST